MEIVTLMGGEVIRIPEQYRSFKPKYYILHSAMNKFLKSFQLSRVIPEWTDDWKMAQTFKTEQIAHSETSECLKMPKKQYQVVDIPY